MGVRNLAQFNKAMEESADIVANPRRLTSDEAKKIVREVDRTTPVRSGNLREKWQVSDRINNRLRGTRPSGRNALGDSLSWLARYDKASGAAKPHIYIFNNAPYAAIIERTHGMLQKAMKRIR